MKNITIKATIHFLTLIFFLTTASSVFALDDRITDEAYFEDATGHVSFSQAIEKNFTSYSGILNRGYNKNIYWLKFSYAKKSPDERLFLRILPTFIDEVKVYQKIGDRWKIDTMGDLYAYDERNRPETSFTQELDKDASQTVYVSLKTKTSKIIDIEVLNEKDLSFAEGRRDLLLGFYFGILTLLIIWTIFSAYQYPDKIIFSFMLFQISELVHGFSLMGYLSKYILSDKPALADNYTSLFVLLHVFAGLIFNGVLLNEIQKIPKLVYIFAVLILCNILLIITFFTVDKGIAVAGSSMLIIPMSILLFYVPFTLRKSKINYERGVFWTYIILGLSLILTMAPYLGIFKATDISLYTTMLNGFITLTALALLLQQRRTDMKRAFYNIKLSAELSRQQVEIEKLKREQQSQFIAMLSHELKTPLSILKIAFSSDDAFKNFKAQITSAISDMTNVIDRSLLADKHENKSLSIQTDRFFLASVLKNKIDKMNVPERFEFTCNINPEINSDLHITKIIITNLLDNAFKYGDTQSLVQITLDQQMIDAKPYANLIISNFPGITGVPDASQIFVKYYRAEKAYSQTGSGLGLYLVKSLSKLLGGDVLYKFQDGRIAFQFLLPVAP